MRQYRRRARLLAALALAFAWGNTLGAQQAAPQRLTLKDAIVLALKKNLSVRVAGAQVDELEGTRERRLAPLLPHVSGDALANRQNINLAALGFSGSAIPIPIPSVISAFNHYDFRVAASQSLIDRHAYHSWKASEKQEQAAKLSYQDARDLVIRQAAGFILTPRLPPRRWKRPKPRDHLDSP